MSAADNQAFRPVHEHTAADMHDHLLSLAPRFVIAPARADLPVGRCVMTARLNGLANYIRVEREPGYGGWAWTFSIMGPSEWGDDEPDDMVRQLCLICHVCVTQVVDALAEMAWRQHVATT